MKAPPQPQPMAPVLHTATGQPTAASQQRVDESSRLGGQRDYLCRLQGIAATGSPPVQRRREASQRRGPVLQRWKDDALDQLTSTTDDTFGNSLNEAESTQVVQMFAEILAIIAAHQDRKILLYVGVGTGNPVTDRGNNSPTAEVELSDQTNPGFLRDAVADQHFVIAVNCNPGLVDHAEETGNEIRLTRKVALPLANASEHDRRAIEAVKAARNAALATGDASGQGRFVLMNSVTQSFYPALYALSTPEKEQRRRIAYLSSYKPTSANDAFNMLSPRLGGHLNEGPKGFHSMSDVFFGYEKPPASTSK